MEGGGKGVMEGGSDGESYGGRNEGDELARIVGGSPHTNQGSLAQHQAPQCLTDSTSEVVLVYTVVCYVIKWRQSCYL